MFFPAFVLTPSPQTCSELFLLVRPVQGLEPGGGGGREAGGGGCGGGVGGAGHQQPLPQVCSQPGFQGYHYPPLSRLLSGGGMQRSVVSLPGPLVTMVGQVTGHRRRGWNDTTDSTDTTDTTDSTDITNTTDSTDITDTTDSTDTSKTPP